MRPEAEVIVIGAGHAGLTVAAALRQRGVEAVVLDQADRIGASWRDRHDSLRLNTETWGSRLLGLPMDEATGRWPTRDEFVRYLERFAVHHDIPTRTATEVTRIERDGSRYVLSLRDQPAVRTPFVVVATGPDRCPVIPEWPGAAAFRGQVAHAVDYRNAAGYEGERVLVAGGGESGADIAVDLARHRAGEVWLSVRTPPFVMPPRVLGMSAQRLAVLAKGQPAVLFDLNARVIRWLLMRDLQQYGLGSPPSLHRSARVRGKAPVLDRGFLSAVREGRIRVCAAVESFDERAVNLADGSALEVDRVIAATGFQPRLWPLVGHLGILRPDGEPRVPAPGVDPAEPGLFLFGFRPILSGNIREATRLARATARRISRAAGHGRGRSALPPGQAQGRDPDSANVPEA